MCSLFSSSVWWEDEVVMVSESKARWFYRNCDKLILSHVLTCWALIRIKFNGWKTRFTTPGLSPRSAAFQVSHLGWVIQIFYASVSLFLKWRNRTYPIILTWVAEALNTNHSKLKWLITHYISAVIISLTSLIPCSFNGERTDKELLYGLYPYKEIWESRQLDVQ
jgi:hypothetical protein